MKKIQEPEVAPIAKRRRTLSVGHSAGRSTLPKEYQEAAELAKWAQRASQLPAVRKELVERVKAQIQAGTYETPDKLDAAIAGLLKELGEA
jgi:anti-sigma28 factor (negative regulator of flagellin synthesis)